MNQYITNLSDIFTFKKSINNSVKIHACVNLGIKMRVYYYDKNSNILK